MPYFLELPTYRWREHCGTNYDNNIGYRLEEVFQLWKSKDPLMQIDDHINLDQLNSCRDQIQNEIDQAFLFAENSCFPPFSAASENVFDSSYLAQVSGKLSTDRVCPLPKQSERHKIMRQLMIWQYI